MSVQHIGHKLTVLESIDSSNNYAMAQVHAGLANHGEAWFALEQTAGKGQRGRQWVTNPGENIMVSIALNTSRFQPDRTFPLSMAVALGCLDWFGKEVVEGASLKWPNDLYWRDRKAGGILIENKWSGNKWQFAIAGIGININQVNFDPMAKRPVSLRQITGREVDLMEALKALFSHLENRWQQLASGDLAGLLKDYNEVLFRKGETVKLKKGNASFETTILGVNMEGLLLTRDTMDRQFQFGEVEWA